LGGALVCWVSKSPPLINVFKEDKAGRDLQRFAKPIVPSGMRFDFAVFRQIYIEGLVTANQKKVMEYQLGEN